MRQKEATGRPLPHRHHLLIEYISSAPGGYPGNQIVLHTIWGGRINRPFAMAVEAAWEDRYGYRPELYPGNDSIMLQLPHEAGGEEILSLVTSANFSGLIRKKLEGSGFFGARFRECAGRALLLTRRQLNERMPLWVSRLRSQRLLDSVLQYEDFPILLEAWRTCLKDELDLEGLAKVLADLESGIITWSEARTGRPSPMAQSITWGQINQYMYMDDQSRSGKGSKLRADLLHEVVSIPELRPAVSVELAERFELKRQRLSPGYSPDSAPDLIEWVKERLLLPESEWERLLGAMRRDHGLDPETVLASIAARLVRINPPNAAEPLIVALENLPRISLGLHWDIDSLPASRLDSGEAFQASRNCADHPLAAQGFRVRAYPTGFEDRDELFTAIFSEWLQFYSPRSMEFVRSTLGLDNDRLAGAVEALIDAERLVSGRLRENDGQDSICDSRNYEVMLRLSRAAAIPAFSALGIDRLQPFLAQWQGLVTPESEAGLDGLFRRIEQLVSYPAPADLWETEIFPARLKPYDLSWLDSIMQQSDLRWVGMSGRRVAFSFEPDLDLLQEEGAGEGTAVQAGEVVSLSEESLRTSPAAKVFRRPEEGRGFRKPLLRLVPSSVKDTANDSKPVAGERPALKMRSEFEGMRGLTQISTGSFRIRQSATIFQLSWVYPTPGRRDWLTCSGKKSGWGSSPTIRSPPFAMGSKTTSGCRTRRRRWPEAAADAGTVRRTGFSMWKGSLPMAGNWMRIRWPKREEDLLERAERGKERVRLLLDRYGILFRELLQNELPAFSWGNIFRSLRLMELSGEVLTGYFFQGVPGPQFISHDAFRMLQRKFPEESVYWICATDPASVCGIRLDALKGKLPRRVPGTHLVYHGSRVGHGITAQRKDPHLSCARDRSSPAILPRIAPPPAHKKISTDAPHCHRNHQRRRRFPEPLCRCP